MKVSRSFTYIKTIPESILFDSLNRRPALSAKASHHQINLSDPMPSNGYMLAMSSKSLVKSNPQPTRYHSSQHGLIPTKNQPNNLISPTPPFLHYFASLISKRFFSLKSLMQVAFFMSGVLLMVYMLHFS